MSRILFDTVGLTLRMSGPLFVYGQLFAGHVIGSRRMKRKKKFASNDNDERSAGKMTTNMVKKRERERSKLQPPPLGLSLRKWKGPYLVPRPHYSARPQSVSVHVHTSPKWIDREGQGKRRTRTRQGEAHGLKVLSWVEVVLIDIKLSLVPSHAAHLFVSNKATNWPHLICCLVHCSCRRHFSQLKSPKMKVKIRIKNWLYEFLFTCQKHILT